MDNISVIHPSSSASISPLAHFELFFKGAQDILALLDKNILVEQVEALCQLRSRSGRLFILGVGGSAANASHAVNDFRKLCGIETYAPTDNVAELTARTNDEGWETVFVEWLKVSNLNNKDLILVLSVGGGNEAKQVSLNLVKALQYAKQLKVGILGIVGRDGGSTKQLGDLVLVIPPIQEKLVTPHAEAFQAIVWHALVSHPNLQSHPNKW